MTKVALQFNQLVMNHRNLPVPGSYLGSPGVLVSYPSKYKRLKFKITVRRTYPDLSIMKELSVNTGDNLKERDYLSHSEIEKLFGISSDDMKVLDAFYKEHNLKCEDIDPIVRTVELSGKIEDIEACFSIKIGIYEKQHFNQYYSYAGNLHLPVSVFHIITKIEGLSPVDEHQYRSPMRLESLNTEADVQVDGYLPDRIAQAYNFPAGATGKGQTIAVIECGGKFSKSDFKKFCSKVGLSKPPTVIPDGRIPKIQNKYRDLFNCEATLDIQVLAAVAPGAKIVIYNTPGILTGMQAILQDKVHHPSVVSISWAIPESLPYSDLEELNHMLQLAALKGITVIAASGDKGAFWKSSNPDVAFPASNPYVLGCGGTILKLDGDSIQSEIAWNEANGNCATGGGFSKFYEQPTYQKTTISKSPYRQSRQRGVPDVAADASVYYGYNVIYNGEMRTQGGTSGATPLWAGLIACLNEKLGKNLGFVNPFLYKLSGTAAFRPIIHGNNNYYRAGPGWNPCTGLGTPNGAVILEELKKMQLS